jgi:hypothetical protein
MRAFYSYTILSMLLSLAGLSMSSMIAEAANSKPPELEKPQGKDICKWCENDPEILGKLGALTHEPIAIGPAAWNGSAAFRANLVASEWVFLETTNFRWASSLGAESLNREGQERMAPYFDRMREAGIKLPKKVKKLDSALQVHIFAMRGEEMFERFLEIIQHKASDFPDKRQAEGPYMGNGRYLGEADKFEIYLHKSSVTHRMFTKEHMGAEVTGSLRWHFRDPHKMVASCPADDSDLRKNKWLWPHVAHNLGHLFLAAYKHFSYQPPIWLDEGFALAMEREAEPTSITTEGEEGTLNEDIRNDDWIGERKQLLKSDEPRMAELFSRRTLGSLSELEAVSCWSRVRFLIEEHPDKFAQFLGTLKGQLDSAGYPTGNDLDGLQRKTMKELWDWSFSDFDAAWKIWLAEQL